MLKLLCRSRVVLALLALTVAYPLGGCSSSSKSERSSDTPAATEKADAGDKSAAAKTEDAGDEFAPLEPYDPPSLAEVDAKAKWIDQPVSDGLTRLRDRLKKDPPLIGVAEALAMRNNSVEENEKIYSVMRQLPASDGEVDYDGTFVHSVAGDAKSLNPLMINSVTEMELLTFTGLQLLNFDVDFKPFAPNWAVKSWQTSSDHMMDKFVLRDDVTWSDGTPLTAHDVAFSFKTIMNPRVPIPSLRSGASQIRWVEAYDDHTVVMFHKEPQASWTENIQFPIIPKHIYEKGIEEDPTLANSDYFLKFEQQPVTCGPYEYVKRNRGEETVLRRRDDYSTLNGRQIRPRPFLKEVRFRVITDPNTTLLALKSGAVDEAILTSEQWLTQSGDEDFYRLNTKVQGSEWTEYHIEWNCKTPFFSDKRVRRAMAYAFDSAEMRKSIFYDLVNPATGVFHADAWMASKNVKPFERDLSQAEKLLDEAGWVDSDGDSVRDKTIDGKLVPFEFTIITYEQPNAIKACSLLKDNLDQIGIVCHVKPTEFTVKTELAVNHKFQALMGGWGTGTDPSTLDNIYKTGQGRNFSQYSNTRVDELFEQGQREFDREKRAKIYAEIHDILWEDQPCLWLYHRKSLYGLNKRFRGLNFSPRDPWGVDPGFFGLWVPKQQ